MSPPLHPGTHQQVPKIARAHWAASTSNNSSPPPSRLLILEQTLLVAQWPRTGMSCRRPGFDSWVGKIPWRRERQPTPVSWINFFFISSVP